LLFAPGEATVVGIAAGRVAIQETHGPRLTPYTFWGEIAFQIGGEEAAYWLSRTTSFGPSANRWALSGLRVMLGGHPGDPATADMLTTALGGPMQPALKQTLYEQLENLPEGLTGEILNGQLHAQPRPAGPHALAESNLQIEVGGPFGKGRGGPGGWWIIVEPELHFVRDTEVAVPDLAGWRRERMPRIPEGHRFEIVPDWVCEVLSPSTESKDREIKMPIYAHYGVAHLWLVDPKRRTLEAYTLNAGEREIIAEADGDQIVAVPPFEAMRLELGSLWS
jgi:Uma2 family endonuclease